MPSRTTGTRGTTRASERSNPAGRFEFIECKLAESPGATQRGFAEIETLVGRDRIISQPIVTPDRGTRRASETVTIADSVSLGYFSND
jgi:hypothetical protein